MYQAILFDLDNTLFDRDRVVGEFLRRHYGLGANEMFLQQFELRDIHHRLRTRLKLASFPAFAAEFARWCERNLLPDPRLHDLLTRLARGHELAIITNGSVRLQKTKIRALRLEPLFKHIFISGSLGARKPERRVFRNALAALELPAEQCLMVGDSPRLDIDGARRAGLATCWISRHKPYDGTRRPDYRIPSVLALPEIVIC